MSPCCTAYLNIMVAESGEVYVALRSTEPVSSSSSGMPVTLTASVNVTAMRIVSPSPYVPSSLDATAVTVGRPVRSSPSPPTTKKALRWYV